MTDDINRNKECVPDAEKPKWISPFVYMLNSILSVACIVIGYLTVAQYTATAGSYNENHIYIIMMMFMISFVILYNHYLYMNAK